MTDPLENLLHSYWKWPFIDFIVDWSIKNMVVFHSYAILPKGKNHMNNPHIGGPINITKWCPCQCQRLDESLRRPVSSSATRESCHFAMQWWAPCQAQQRPRFDELNTKSWGCLSMGGHPSIVGAYLELNLRVNPADSAYSSRHKSEK
jgi:hypothetical protein